MNNEVDYQSVNLDFTIKTYKILIKTLIDQGFSFFTFSDYLSGQNHNTKSIILRHDVDKLPLNSLLFAQIQKEFGLRSTYYFRMVPASWDENVISQIASMGHEIGYHYEDLSLVWNRLPTHAKLSSRNSIDLKSSIEAIASFEKNLMKLRGITPILTICMHGSPLSQWDSRMLWKYYDFRDYGIIGEPYFSLDFSKMLYLTDTGRTWITNSSVIRDKPCMKSNLDNEWRVKPVKGSLMNMTEEGMMFQEQFKFKSSFHILNNINSNLPDKIMMTFHPQRWSGEYGSWLNEFITQNFKNSIKYFLASLN